MKVTLGPGLDQVRTGLKPGFVKPGLNPQGGNLCFVCQKVPWYFRKGECFYFMKTHFLQKSDGALSQTLTLR